MTTTTKMRVFIAGADGFVGTILKNGLTDKGYEVHGSVFMRDPANENETKLDVSKPESFQNIPPGDFDVVINNAGVVNQTTPTEIMFAVNAEGTKNTLEWAASRNCKHFVQVSSISVVGLQAMGQNRTEQTTKRSLHLGAPYQRSKARGEQYVEQGPLQYTILRLPSVLGRGDTIMTPAIAGSLQDGSFFTCGNDDPLMSIIYVNDFPDMVDRVLQKGPSNQIYNASSHSVKWMEIVRQYANELGGVNIPETKKSLLSMMTHMDDKMYLYLLVNSRFGAHFPNDKFCTVFDYLPTNSWQDGVKDAVEGFKEDKEQKEEAKEQE